MSLHEARDAPEAQGSSTTEHAAQRSKERCSLSVHPALSDQMAAETRDAKKPRVILMRRAILRPPRSRRQDDVGAGSSGSLQDKEAHSIGNDDGATAIPPLVCPFHLLPDVTGVASRAVLRAPRPRGHELAVSTLPKPAPLPLPKMVAAREPPVRPAPPPPGLPPSGRLIVAEIPKAPLRRGSVARDHNPGVTGVDLDDEDEPVMPVPFIAVPDEDSHHEEEDDEGYPRGRAGAAAIRGIARRRTLVPSTAQPQPRHTRCACKCNAAVLPAAR